MKRLMLLFVAAGFLATANAEPLSGRLARIKETGILVAAHGETGIPFTYLNDGKPAGFGVDITTRILDGLREQLGNPNIRIRWNAVTLSTRLPMVAGNAVDIECAATTNTRQRQATVAFSKTIFVSDEGIVSRRNAGIKDYADLAGKRVAVVAGTPNAQSLKELAEAGKMKIEIIEVRNNRNSMRMVADGRADAFVAAKPILAGQVAGLGDAGDFTIVGNGRFREAFACVLPKDDPAFKQVVDQVLAGMMKSGEMERIYDKWFMKPIPPRNATINLPLNDATRAVYAEPSDTPIEN